MEDKFFKYAVVLSLLLHFGLFVKLYIAPKRTNVVQKSPELAYHLETKSAEPQIEADTQKSSSISPSELVRTDGMFKEKTQEIIAPPFKEGFDMASQFKVFERAPEKVKGLKVTKEVSIPVLKSEKIDTPGYAMYTGIIRDRIRERAYVNFVKFSGGDVYLTFVIRSDGKLLDVQVLQNRTQASEALCAVGISSIREASPFPPFPKELNYPELTFNIQISFQSHEGE